MASRVDPVAPAETSTTGAGPGLGGLVRASLTDFYFHSLRLVPANVVWGASAVLLAIVFFTSPVAGLLLAPLLAVPASGVFQVAAGVVRGGTDGPNSRFAWPGRRAAGIAIALGAAVVAIGSVLVTNIATGLSQGGPPGWILATLAGWGLVALWCGAFVVWPILVDPARADMSIRDRLRVAGTLLLVDPLRFGGLGLLVALIVVVSVVLTAAILTVSIAFVALIACRVVYPVADRLDGATALRRP